MKLLNYFSKIHDHNTITNIHTTMTCLPYSYSSPTLISTSVRTLLTTSGVK